jgi:hypothetical protein
MTLMLRFFVSLPHAIITLMPPADIDAIILRAATPLFFFAIDAAAADAAPLRR